MKIPCEKCHEDISYEVNKNIENYNVGHTICPKCHYEQKRYISESDLLLYFAVNECIYMILSYLAIFLYDHLGISWPTILILLAVIIFFYFLAKQISSSIYVKAYGKQEIKNKEFAEDQKAISRNLSWQFLLFFAITISYMTIPEAKNFFAWMMPLAVIFSFIKYYLQLRNEKEANKK